MKYCSRGHEDIPENRNQPNRCLPCIRERQRLSRSRGKTCPQGHPRTPENRTKTRGQCRLCKAEAARIRRIAAGGTPNSERTTCRNGHPYTDENRMKYGNRTGTRCRLCTLDQATKRRLARRAVVKTDGWEDEFGPIPPRDPNLVDWVLELRRQDEMIRQGRYTREKGSMLHSGSEGQLGACT